MAWRGVSKPICHHSNGGSGLDLTLSGEAEWVVKDFNSQLGLHWCLVGGVCLWLNCFIVQSTLVRYLSGISLTELLFVRYTLFWAVIWECTLDWVVIYGVYPWLSCVWCEHLTELLFVLYNFDRIYPFGSWFSYKYTTEAFSVGDTQLNLNELQSYKNTNHLAVSINSVCDISPVAVWNYVSSS